MRLRVAVDLLGEGGSKNTLCRGVHRLTLQDARLMLPPFGIKTLPHQDPHRAVILVNFFQTKWKIPQLARYWFFQCSYVFNRTERLLTSLPHVAIQTHPLIEK
uniref:Uncharacterized protein n=1 Tax=Opuntia streptacantha TaxID=393608 RepID=A0A7C9ACX2_OPUST